MSAKPHEEPAEETFNPAEHFIQVQGKQAYLEVKFRVLWLRKEAPESQIRSEIIQLDEQGAVFKATATKIVEGAVVGIGEGHGSETKGDWKDYIEKAETKAIGRALAALGYGTAAAFEEEPSRIADAPVKQAHTRPTAPAPAPKPMANGQPLASDKQLRMMRALATQKGKTAEEMKAYILAQFSKTSSKDLTSKEISRLIDDLQAQPDVHTQAEPGWLRDVAYDTTP